MLYRAFWIKPLALSNAPNASIGFVRMAINKKDAATRLNKIEIIEIETELVLSSAIRLKTESLNLPGKLLRNLVDKVCNTAFNF
jgi:hypothetical protein